MSANSSGGQEEAKPFPALAGPDARRAAKNLYEQEPGASRAIQRTSTGLYLLDRRATELARSNPSVSTSGMVFLEEWRSDRRSSRAVSAIISLSLVMAWPDLMSPGFTRIRRARCRVASRSWSKPPRRGPQPALRSAPFRRLMAGNFQPANCCLAESRWELRGLDQELRHLAVGGPLQNSEADPVFSAQAAVFHPPSGFRLNRRSPKRGDRVRPRAVLSGLATSSRPGCGRSRTRRAAFSTGWRGGIVESKFATGVSRKESTAL